MRSGLAGTQQGVVLADAPCPNPGCSGRGCCRTRPRTASCRPAPSGTPMRSVSVTSRIEPDPKSTSLPPIVYSPFSHPRFRVRPELESSVSFGRLFLTFPRKSWRHLQVVAGTASGQVAHRRQRRAAAAVEELDGPWPCPLTEHQPRSREPGCRCASPHGWSYALEAYETTRTAAPRPCRRSADGVWPQHRRRLPSPRPVASFSTAARISGERPAPRALS